MSIKSSPPPRIIVWPHIARLQRNKTHHRFWNGDQASHPLRVNSIDGQPSLI
jgi:hypothetical protein